MEAQDSRQEKLDPRLHTSQTSQEREKMLRTQLGMREESSLVARDAEGRVRGYVLPGMWEMTEEDEMIAFFARRMGAVQQWVLPAPTESDAVPIAHDLLDALTTSWQQQKTYGDLVRWPSSDLWIEPTLFKHGFLVDSLMALRSLEPLPPSKHPVAASFQARMARPEDEDAIVQLHREELAFHLPYTPFVRITHSLETAMRARLALIWSGTSVLDGAPLVVVVEHEGKIVAMAENALMVVKDFGGFGLTPAGRYGYLNNVSVSEKMRGQGVGHFLVKAVFAAFAPYHLDAYLLWYSSDNPRANTFWPHLGFRPLWKTYQRRNRDDGVKSLS